MNSGEERSAVAIWFASRVGVALLALGGAWQLSAPRVAEVEGPLARWDRWDVGLFRKVAEFGYAGYPDAYPDRGIEAFFPGMPLVLALTHRVVPDWTAAGLLVSLVAGAVAVGWLARLAALDGASGSQAALYLVLSPAAVFLAAGYSEALFLCVALPGWWCARSGHWRAAGLLVAAACTVRVSGAFLAVALVLQYALTGRSRRSDPLWLLVPFVALLSYAGYLRVTTGDWLRWLHAQEEGWSRSFSPPWDALALTWRLAGEPTTGADYAWSFRAEIVAVGVGVVLTAVLLVRARWAEATYVGLSVGALATSTFYLSVARATLLWFPLWVLLAQAAEHRPWVRSAYVAVAAPLMALGVLTFTSGRWLG